MAQIRHLAICTPDPDKLADYYVDVFGLTKTGHSSLGAVWLTDGHIDVALLPMRDPNAKKGVNHWGFTLELDEKERVFAKMNGYGIVPHKPTSERPYVEVKGYDVDGNMFDMATSAVEKGEAGAPVKMKPTGVDTTVAV
jgi:catechol 2,3-dioxygenase-like lactoylglutathione lyase family enzyme